MRTISGLSETNNKDTSKDTDKEAIRRMDPNRVMLMSKFKALNKGMNDALAQKQARLTRIRLLNAYQSTPPSSVSVVSDDDASEDTLTAAGISTYCSVESSSTASSSRMSLRRNGPLAKYLDSGNNSDNRKTDDHSHKMSLPDLLSIREDDDDISDYFEDCSDSDSQ